MSTGNIRLGLLVVSNLKRGLFLMVNSLKKKIEVFPVQILLPPRPRKLDFQSFLGGLGKVGWGGFLGRWWGRGVMGPKYSIL